MRKLVAVLGISGLLFACQGPADKDAQSGNEPSEQVEQVEQENNQAEETGKAKPTMPSDSISQLITKNPDDAELYAERANYYLARNRFQAALNDISEALRLDSNLGVAYEAKGEYHYALNQSRQARDAWQRCIKLDPNNSDCLLKLSELMVAVQDYEKALELVNRQLDINNKDGQAYFIKGIILRDKYQDTAAALQYFQNAIDRQQNFTAAWDMMGTTLLQKGDTLAKFYFQRVLELQPNRDDIYHKLGIYYMNNDQPNRALENYTKALQINPNNAESLYNLGYMHTTFDQYEKAEEFFTRAIEAGDRDYKSYFGRGLTYEMRGEFQKAREDYREALEVLPVFKPASKALGRVNKTIREQQNGGGQ